jgi:protein FrlC
MLSEADICAMNFHYARFPLDAFLDDVVRIGVEQVEIWGAAPHFYTCDTTLAEARELKQRLAGRGVRLACFTPEQCVYPINLSSREVRLRDRSLRYFLDCLEVCAEMESPALLVTPGSGYANEPATDAWDRCVEALRRITSRAEQLGVTVYLEALPRAWSNVIVTASDLEQMVEAVGSSALSGMVDTAGAIASGETTSAYTDRLGGALGHVHMVDSDAGGAHLSWGDGLLSASEIVGKLNAVGYKGALSIEITNPRYYLDPFPSMKASVEALRAAVAS